MKELTENWCQRDEHNDFELFEDFNAKIDQGEVQGLSELLENLDAIGLSHTSKAFYAGDKEAYEQALRAYRIERRNQVLSHEYFIEAFGEVAGQHWFERNQQRFNQLINLLDEESVVPFIGAGISVSCGFPTWANHLRQQGQTAGVNPKEVEDLIASGQFEQIIANIECLHGRDTFAQEIRDVFSKNGSIQDITIRISELFRDTLITTNYDRLLEQIFDTGSEPSVQVINGTEAMESPESGKVTIVKVHGDIQKPLKCILAKAQYDQAYGKEELDMEKPIPKLLKYYFQSSNLLFIGCSLNNDRTIQVFKKVKEISGDFDFPQHFSIEQAPEDLEELTQRNSELCRYGITAIWYPNGQYNQVEEILSHAKNELNYTKANIGSFL